ncbi:MAG TPA: flagellar basal body-associated FliL family protein [Chloroflexota bacterium]|nr:flagellar basal body-associated FliL family protein [Chloroflexota bacterium]
MKKLLFPILLVVGGLALGAGGFFGASKVLGKGETAAPPWNPQPGDGIGYVTKERVVNLADPGAMRYLKTTVVIELASSAKKGPAPKGEEYKKAQDELAKELKGKAAIVDDTINTLLGSKTSAELTRPDGREHLKDELKERLQEPLDEYKILAIYFTDFIIQ